ncbi:MAG: hypothetical protein LBF22_13200, partial [Deltaproteobacteria bacterium]|nr:hypothetical protein [Deltaproteobacteria bacterium]
MPELPEVFTIAKDLNLALVGKQISDIQIKYPPLLAKTLIQNEENSEQLFLNSPIEAINPIGKLLFFSFKNGRGFMVSLRMTGQFIWGTAADVNLSHIHAIFQFVEPVGPEGQKILLYRDIRKFGRIYFCDQANFCTLLFSLHQS